ncbi:putative YccA/Bax inhibitor family protein [Anaeroplasma bactoclasticum]|jgi:uncharacterized YccA/Bax inhibitor family protein|uniref:Putative YccA/Bax inhibitor family protein n=1 Tax=Anaeroplasma bactoclasticum TaxID=2088 RepID=A0A397RYD9_9MOLU|nr:Bax inhibitor-1/YccA family protein [Anaeroplasma bactoclasticum]RIA78292.1 putative YccA/Bax inhibitor family protein [Anaeroplasma bactoclasticum]
MNNTGYYSYVKTSESYLDETSHATYKGISIKTIILLAIVIGIATVTAIFLPELIKTYENSFYGFLIASIIVGFICAIVGRFSERLAMVCSIIYSLCEGVLLGTITAKVNQYFPGAGSMAIAATLVVFAIMLVLYSLGFIRNGSMLRMIAFGILFSVLGLAIFDLLLIIFKGYESNSIYFLIQAGLLIYGVITLAFNFAEAEAVVKLGASKKAEWSVALGIEISLIYIYIYILRIILMFSRRN